MSFSKKKYIYIIYIGRRVEFSSHKIICSGGEAGKCNSKKKDLNILSKRLDQALMIQLIHGL